jgi:pantetheine hydrolase
VPTTKTIVCFRHKRNKICCHFHIIIFFNSALSLKGRFYTYHLVAYKGFKNYYNVFSRGGVEICGIIACLDSKLESCGKRFGHYDEVIWPVLFKNITIKANFTEGFCPPSRPCTQYPNSLLSSMRPIHTNFTKWETKVYPDQKHPILEKTFSLVEPQDRLFTFAIFGRNFSMKPTKRSGYENLVIANFWITVTFPYLCSII